MIKRALRFLAGLARAGARGGRIRIRSAGQAPTCASTSPPFRRPTPADSLKPGHRDRRVHFTSTLFAGMRYKNTEFYYNPELVSGVPLSELHGLGDSPRENQPRRQHAGARLQRRAFLPRRGISAATSRQDPSRTSSRRATPRPQSSSPPASCRPLCVRCDGLQPRSRTAVLQRASLTYELGLRGGLPRATRRARRSSTSPPRGRRASDDSWCRRVETAGARQGLARALQRCGRARVPTSSPAAAESRRGAVFRNR